MGEIADMIIDGTLDQHTGELLDGKSPGYPRSRPRHEVPGLPPMRACPDCGKKCRGQQGLADHKKAKH